MHFFQKAFALVLVFLSLFWSPSTTTNVLSDAQTRLINANHKPISSAIVSIPLFAQEEDDCGQDDFSIPFLLLHDAKHFAIQYVGPSLPERNVLAVQPAALPVYLYTKKLRL